MKWNLSFPLFLCCFLATTIAFAQSEKILKADRNTTKAILNAERRLECDDIDKSQQWLNYAKKQNQFAKNPTNSYLISSLQSEVFYYLGLYQFGRHEAAKGIEQAKVLKDSILVSDAYFFMGINQFEMGQNKEALQSLVLSEHNFPKIRKQYMRTIISKAHIYNNIAQIKLKLQESDSAIYYNNKAYKLAKKTNSRRVIANAEQIFGMIYSQEKQSDSAKYYFQKSVTSALSSHYYDIALLSTGFLTKCYPDNQLKTSQIFQQGKEMMAANNINILYKKYFFKTVLEGFTAINDQQKVVELQRSLIAIDDEMDQHENLYVQDITEDYIKSENDLLNSKINELRQQKNITILQLVATLLFVLILLFVIISIRRKNKLQQSLLRQKNEISKDLHDDIGSELSSILINANLLIKNFDTNDKQQQLLSKISVTSGEISQRLNTFIWSLNNENNGISNFCEYVNQYATKLFDGTDIVFNYSQNITLAESQVLNGYFRKNLFFCIKEVLNNAAKHANAKNISVTISVKDKKELNVVITDDGNGMQDENTFGNGIKNIQKRVETLCGQVDFKQYGGLKVTLSAPFPQN